MGGSALLKWHETILTSDMLARVVKDHTGGDTYVK